MKDSTPVTSLITPSGFLLTSCQYQFILEHLNTCRKSHKRIDWKKITNLFNKTFDEKCTTELLKQTRPQFSKNNIAHWQKQKSTEKKVIEKHSCNTDFKLTVSFEIAGIPADALGSGVLSDKNEGSGSFAGHVLDKDLSGEKTQKKPGNDVVRNLSVSKTDDSARIAVEIDTLYSMYYPLEKSEDPFTLNQINIDYTHDITQYFL